MSSHEVQGADPPDIAVANFERGYNCAEAILSALSPGGARAIPDAQRAGTALGAGLARWGLVCGCLTGCAVAVGLRLGRVDPEDTESKELCYRVIGNVMERFERAHGTVECARLTGLDFRQPNPQQELDRVHAEVCTKLVRFVAKAALAELEAAERGSL